jgi:hypothetical protein
MTAGDNDFKGDIKTGSPEERKGLALAALIISIVAFLCAFIPGWKLFASVCGVASLSIAVFCISKARKPGSRARLALWSMAVSILSLLAVGYFLLTSNTTPENDPGINEPVQVIEPAETDEAFNRLKNATDSTGNNNQ